MSYIVRAEAVPHDSLIYTSDWTANDSVCCTRIYAEPSQSEPAGMPAEIPADIKTRASEHRASDDSAYRYIHSTYSHRDMYIFLCEEYSLITSGARSAERVLLWFKGEISVCAARPDPTRPDPVTLLRSLYLWNGLIDSRAVFFVRCNHSINFVFDRCRYPPVPATARGTCRGEGVEDTLSLGNSTTAGPIAFKFGV